MKKLVTKFILLFIFAFGLFCLVDYFSCKAETKELVAKLTGSSEYLGEETGTDSIISIIRAVNIDDGTNVLVIGDSISGQLFSGLAGECPDTRIACGNAAINISGQYLLAVNYLENHPDTTDVWLFAHPLTLDRGYDMELGYGYAVMPFAIEGILDELDDVTLDQMAGAYGRVALNPAFAGAINRSPLNRKLFFSYIRMHNEEYIQENAYEIASLYILKLADICREKGINFHFYSSPSTEYFRDRIESTRDDFNASELSKAYPDYLDSIYYFPTEWSKDYTHFDDEHAVREVYNEIINNAYDEFFTDT